MAVVSRREQDALQSTEDNPLAEATWCCVSWGRTVNNVFLQESNAHRCLRVNLSKGSVSAMRKL